MRYPPGVPKPSVIESPSGSMRHGSSAGQKFDAVPDDELLEDELLLEEELPEEDAPEDDDVPPPQAVKTKALTEARQNARKGCIANIIGLSIDLKGKSSRRA